MALHEARQALKRDQISVADYRRMEEVILQSKDFKPSKSYAALLENSYASLDNMRSSIHDAEAGPNGYPSPLEEQSYLDGLDAYLDGNASMPRPFAAARAGERSTEKDKEMALKNPVSVYNWLRKHQPQVFLQDNEMHAEKPSRLATSRASKRVSVVKQEPELYDEDGIAIDVGSSSRGKRKRDDDGGYRPKGGNGRPMKRKKEEGSTSAKKGKRASISALT
jgi:IEC3 subunit of the Ino80 complex, chromatin re-modelling